MSDEEQPPNGAPPLSDEETAMARAMMEQAIGELAGFLKHYFPEATDQQLVDAAAQSFLEQQQLLATCLQDVAIAAEDTPRWGLQIMSRRHPGQSQLLIPKKPGELSDLTAVTGWACAMALATSPQARACLRLMGAQVKFVQAREKSRLIVPR